ncbi:UrcA family protein [Novosphingobium bradum]|uniref:UrcA family protein n=1 Tax=Novosphingobium bradum TaxID=1737444 RepID=A0ABV7IM65_9SPHN
MTFTSLVAPIALLAMTAGPALAAGDEITAIGRIWHGSQVSGPDPLGRYTLRVNIADLDPATPDGWSVMARRVAMGTSLLCDAAAPRPYFGYFYQENRDCRAESAAMAGAQMTRARDLARSGEHVAYLDVAR